MEAHPSDTGRVTRSKVKPAAPESVTPEPVVKVKEKSKSSSVKHLGTHHSPFPLETRKQGLSKVPAGAPTKRSRLGTTELTDGGGCSKTETPGSPAEPVEKGMFPSNITI